MPLEQLRDRVAVVTGGASGIGRAMGERFAEEGMRVVLADVEEAALEATAKELRDRGLEVEGVQTDVTAFESVDALAEGVYRTHGAVHLLCNNAGVGSGAEGRIWEYELTDWGWALAVNVWGVVHGLNAFVPRMLAGGEEGHVVNTSSGNGGISPLPTASVYAMTKAAVVTISECLYQHLREIEAPVGASVLFPGPNMLKTGLWNSQRNRPPEFEKSKPRQTPPPSLDEWEEAMKAAGLEVEYTPVEEVAARVVEGVLAGRFWILPESERTDDSIRRRAQSMLERSNPTYLETFVVDEHRKRKAGAK